MTENIVPKMRKYPLSGRCVNTHLQNPWKTLMSLHNSRSMESTSLDRVLLSDMWHSILCVDSNDCTVIMIFLLDICYICKANLACLKCQTKGSLHCHHVLVLLHSIRWSKSSSIGWHVWARLPTVMMRVTHQNPMLVTKPACRTCSL